MEPPQAGPEGRLDGVGQRVTGWAWVPAAPDRRLRVTVLFGDGSPDGTVRVETMADGHRGDLTAAGKGDGCCSFSVPVPEAFAGREHRVDLRLPDFPGVRLPGTPRRAIFTLGPVRLRIARPVEADVEGLRAFLGELAALNGGSAAAIPDAPDLRLWLAAPDRCWLIAERAGRIVGHCRLGPEWPAEPDAGALALGIELHPDVQGFGLGRHLLLGAHRWAAGRCARVDLAVLPHNARALRLYQSLGYADLGPVRLPATGEIHRRMAVDLPPGNPFTGVLLVV